MTEKQAIREGQILTGLLLNEPMRVETVRSNGPDPWCYLVYSTAKTDESRLRQPVTELNQLQKRIYEKRKLYSDCMFV